MVKTRSKKRFSPWTPKKRTSNKRHKKIFVEVELEKIEFCGEVNNVEDEFLIETKDSFCQTVDSVVTQTSDSFCQTLTEEPLNVVVTFQPTFAETVSIKTQTDQFVFTCPRQECGLNFNTSGYLKRHINKHFKLDKEKICKNKSTQTTIVKIRSITTQTNRDSLFEKYMQMYYAEVQKFEYLTYLHLQPKNDYL